MKRFFWILALALYCGWLSTSAEAQTLSITPAPFSSSVSNSNAINLIGTGISNHSFSWYTSGTVSAGACALLGSADNVTYGTTIISAQTVTSSGGPTAIASGVYNYVKLSCTTPITGSGTVTIRYSGTSSNSGAGATVTANAGTNLNTSALNLEATQLLVLAAVNDTTPVAINNAAVATGGATTHSIISAASTNSTNVKSSAGTVYHVFATNTNTALRYIRLYNLASAPTCSSATGILWRGVIPPASASGQVGGLAVNFTPVGGAFSTGIGYCITTTVSDTDNNAIGAGDVVLDILWQ